MSIHCTIPTDNSYALYGHQANTSNCLEMPSLEHLPCPNTDEIHSDAIPIPIACPSCQIDFTSSLPHPSNQLEHLTANSRGQMHEQRIHGAVRQGEAEEEEEIIRTAELDSQIEKREKIKEECLHQQEQQQQQQNPSAAGPPPLTKQALVYRPDTARSPLVASGEEEEEEDDDDEGNRETCSLCTEDLDTASRELGQLPCKQHFHMECTSPWLETRMETHYPLCRHEYKVVLMPTTDGIPHDHATAHSPREIDGILRSSVERERRDFDADFVPMGLYSYFDHRDPFEASLPRGTLI